jgi:hypothetical protein
VKNEYREFDDVKGLYYYTAARKRYFCSRPLQR